MTPVSWPAIPDVASRTLSQAALWLYEWFVAQQVRESGGPNRGPWPDHFNGRLGLPVPQDPTATGFPWCTSSAFCIFEEASRQKRVVNPFPRTAKAVGVRNLADPVTLVSNPAPGCIIIVDHGKEWAAELGTGKRLTDNGHCCIANATVTGDLSGNTNAAGSREGDRFAEKLWPDGGDAAAVHGGIVVSIHNFDLAPTRAVT